MTLRLIFITQSCRRHYFTVRKNFHLFGPKIFSSKIIVPCTALNVEPFYWIWEKNISHRFCANNTCLIPSCISLNFVFQRITVDSLITRCSQHARFKWSIESMRKTHMRRLCVERLNEPAQLNPNMISFSQSYRNVESFYSA